MKNTILCSTIIILVKSKSNLNIYVQIIKNLRDHKEYLSITESI